MSTKKNAYVKQLMLTVFPLFLVMFVGFIVPLFMMGERSLFSPGFTWENYQKFFASETYLMIFGRTFRIALNVTLLSLLLGYPVAYFLAGCKEKTANLLRIFIIVPFWISILIRTFAWKVILSDTGLINNFLMSIGLIQEPITMLYNTPAVYIGMTHIELPFMIMALYGVMKNIDRRYFDAALSLGAHPVRAFCRVYLPLSIPGVLSGTLMVFIMSLGFYITPTILGGSKDTVLSVLIETQVTTAMNWPFGSAIAIVLLIATVIIIMIYNKVLGADKLGGVS